MKRLIERILIKILKYLKVDLLSHAHIQIGAGHNGFNSGEDFVINTAISKILLKEPAIIFDIGANIGNYSRSLRLRFANSIIYCFEPVAKNFQALTKNTEGLDLIYNQIGFSSKDECFSLFIGDENPMGDMATAYPECLDSILPMAGKASTAIECEFRSLDNYCEENNIIHIDFLKIDVEGHELEVLKGASRMIKENNISLIQFEFNEFNIISKSFMKNFYDILPQFAFYRIMPKNGLFPLGAYSSGHEIFRYQNFLAINTDLGLTYTKQ